MPKGRRPTGDFPELRKRLGLTPPDTEFTRRAAEWARLAVDLARSKAYSARMRAARVVTKEDS